MKKSMRMIAVALALTLVLLLAPSAFAESVVYDTQKLDTNYTLALAYIGREDYDKAMDYLNACLQYCDENSAPTVYADVHLKIACVHTIHGDYDKALAELDEALRVDPKLSEAYLVKTQVHSDLGDYESAAAALQQYIDLTGDESLYELKAEIYSAVGNVDKALESYRVFAENDSDSAVEAAYKLGIYNMEMSRFETAIEKFEECRNDQTYGPSSIYNIAVCYMRLENYEKALENFELVKNEEFEGLLYNTGVCSMLLDKTDEAIAAFTASIESEPFVSDALYNRAICYVSQSAFEPAVTDFSAYLDGLKAAEVERLNEQEKKDAAAQNRTPAEIKAENVEDVVDVATYYRGVCYLSLGLYEQSVADFDACIAKEVAPNDSTFNRGLAHLQAGQYESAKADFTKCAEADYNKEASLYYRSFALLGLEDYEGAVADLSACIDAQYNLQQTYYQRAQVYMVMGEEEKYIADLEASLQF